MKRRKLAPRITPVKLLPLSPTAVLNASGDSFDLQKSQKKCFIICHDLKESSIILKE